MEAYRQLSPNSWEARSTLIGGLNDSLRRQSSGIDTMNVYKKLALPEGLIEILSDS